MELAEESREITTFVTHRGLYRYRKLMFGIASAPEIYQKIVKDVLRDCMGAENIADEVIVHGRGVKEHDENLFAVLNRLKECGLTLNGGKCKFRLPRLTIYGHDLGKQRITPSEEKTCDRKCTKPKECIRSEIISRTCAIFCQVPAELRRGGQTTKTPHQKGSEVHMGRGPRRSIQRAEEAHDKRGDAGLLQE